MKEYCNNCNDPLEEGQIGLCDDCQPKYNVFHRTWWKEATKGGWPNNLEPEKGEKNDIEDGQNVSREEAIRLCKEWNEQNDPGRYSDKAEFEEV